MWDDFLLVLEDLAAEDADNLIDDLQEQDAVLNELCKHTWLMELIITICKAKKHA